MASEQQPVIPGYRIVGKLGQGGMAAVWRAEQTSLGRTVALKVVSNHLAADERTRARFLREAQLSAKVVHPNVITCYDAGSHGGQLFMALELVTGGDLKQLLEREGGRIDPWRALRLVHDCLLGLAAIEEAGLIHRDIKPGNIFLDARGVPKLADLGLAKPSGTAELTMPGMVVGTPSYIAPEQARSVPDLDIRADIYALGATLFHLVAGRTPYPGNDPMGVLVAVLNDPVPDLRQVAPDAPPEIAQLCTRLMAKERERRPASARTALSQVAGLLEGRLRPTTARVKPAPQAAARPSGQATPAAASPAPAPVRTPQTTATKAAGVQIDAAQLEILAKRIIVDQGGLRAALALAPGASFPRWMLDQIVTAAGIVHGLIEDALHAATFPREVPRRLTLARGTPPSPGVPGRSVRGDPLPGLAVSVSIEVSPDRLQAVAYTRPGQTAAKADLERGIKEAQLRFGLDAEALKRLVDGPPASSGRTVIARGRAADPGRTPGWTLCGDIANTTVADLASGTNLRRVAAGEIIALWDDGVPARAGMDVTGQELPAPVQETLTPERAAGAGTEQARAADGALALRARVAGFAQRQPDGCVRVVGIFAVEGDLGPDDPPIVTDDVVVVRGTVRKGASITSSSDVVIMGDLEDAVISAGGNVEVDGAVGEGPPIEAGGALVLRGVGEGRTLMAGSLKIEGEVRNCELRATGDVRVRKLVGGAITAGGNVSIDCAGDGDGASTVVWAGHHLTRAEEAKLAELAAKHADVERARVMRQRQAMEGDIARMQGAQTRMAGAAFVNQAAAREMSERLQRIEAEAERARKADEEARRRLAQTRQEAKAASEKGENARARIDIGTIAYAGVVVKLADAEPEVLKEPRLKLKMGV